MWEAGGCGDGRRGLSGRGEEGGCLWGSRNFGLGVRGRSLRGRRQRGVLGLCASDRRGVGLWVREPEAVCHCQSRSTALALNNDGTEKEARCPKSYLRVVVAKQPLPDFPTLARVDT